MSSKNLAICWAPNLLRSKILSGAGENIQHNLGKKIWPLKIRTSSHCNFQFHEKKKWQKFYFFLLISRKNILLFSFHLFQNIQIVQYLIDDTTQFSRYFRIQKIENKSN